MPDEEELESMMVARHTPNVHHKVKKGKVGDSWPWVDLAPILPLCLQELVSDIYY